MKLTIGEVYQQVINMGVFETVFKYRIFEYKGIAFDQEWYQVQNIETGIKSLMSEHELKQITLPK